ncbi:hypothetical protein [Natrinema salaciae]|uniref:Uncharacterized protein n=1 Tax=Natrinema salaciae TaxID=1186196 RepID=A0A1H9PUM4_9EURY|nr:hypothetical protein [Natrinema salaciae]SER51489.1 hypothetical protein SAMN04489841_3971 [Natrinema salaciae]
MLPLLLNAPEIPNSIKWLGAILAAIAAIITAYRFFLQRPKLQLLVDKDRDIVLDNQVVSHPTFKIVNRGNAPAHDVYFDIRAPTWNFGEEQKGGALKVEVSVDDTAEADDETTESDDSNGQESEYAPLSFEDSPLTVDHNFMTYFGRPGEINQMFIDDTIYSDVSFRIFSTKLKLERFRTYGLEYKVGCQTYGPRKGTIEFEVGYDSININHQPPRFWRAWLRKIKQPLDNLSPDPYAWIRKAEIKTQRASFFHELVRPFAEVQVVGSPNEYFSLNAKATVYLDETEPESTIGTVTFNENGLSGGEIAEIRREDGKYRLPTTRFESDHSNFRQMPFIVSPHFPSPKPLTSSRIEIDWEVELSPVEKGDFRGLSIENDNITGRDQPNAGHRPVRVSGNIANKNNQSRGIFVVVKFYTEDDRVVSTNHTEVGVSPRDSTEFNVSPRLPREQELRIDDYEIIMQRSI